MSRSAREIGVRSVVFIALVTLLMGCLRKPDAPPGAQEDPSDPAPAGPSEVELSDPKVTFRDPTTVMFEVNYRFKSGRPNKYYSCDISFTGLGNDGARPEYFAKRMESWELKAKGVIKDGVVLSKPGPTSFAIHLTEASSPQGPFKKISNVVSGPVK
jgi:hypothetical protein